MVKMPFYSQYFLTFIFKTRRDESSYEALVFTVHIYFFSGTIEHCDS